MKNSLHKIDVRPSIQMQLGKSDIQLSKNIYLKLVKGDSDMK